ncbi:hypothetical protein [Streptomyces sp. NPDC006875]|uniref:hypothetical protein n=1 Tax=Streptomyces sp. NPDC006875 TaxID=3154781 RepID=UPI0033D9CADE
MFHAARARALPALDAIEFLDADAIAPGHGPVHHGSPEEAVAAVRRHAETRRQVRP